MRKIQKLATRTGNKGMVVKKIPTTPIVNEQKAKIVLNKIEVLTPVINILTRTSGRPNGFKRCYESIQNQTYKNIRHIVSIDNLEDEAYVKVPGVEYFLMNKEEISAEPDIADPKTGGRFIFNLYLNKLIEKVEDGFIIFLDDDDYLTDKFVIQKIVNSIKSNTDMILWQMKYPNGNVLPSIQELGKTPRIARIGAPCFAVHSGIAKTIKWDGWKCGDFRFIQKVWAKTGDKRVVKETLISLGGAGLGKRNDINVNVNNSNGDNVNSSEIDGKAVLRMLGVKASKSTPLINKANNNIFSIKETYDFLLNLSKNNVNYSFTRFGDNDIFQMQGKYKDKVLGGNKTKFSNLLQRELLSSINLNDDYYIKSYNFGISGWNEKTPLCSEKFKTEEFNFVKSIDNKSKYHSAFIFYYLAIYSPNEMQIYLNEAIRNKKILYIGGNDKKNMENIFGNINYYINTPKQGASEYIIDFWEQTDYLLLNNEVDVILPICGQLGRVLQKKIWEKYPNKYSIIDISSIVDAYEEKPTRSYLKKNSEIIRKNIRYNGR